MSKSKGGREVRKPKQVKKATSDAPVASLNADKAGKATKPKAGR